MVIENKDKQNYQHISNFDKNGGQVSKIKTDPMGVRFQDIIQKKSWSCPIRSNFLEDIHALSYQSHICL